MFEEFAVVPHLLTWVDLQPGDQLVAPVNPGWNTATLDVTFAPLAGAESYTIATTLDSDTVGTSPATVNGRTNDNELAVLGVSTVDGALAWAGATATLPSSTVDLGAWSMDVRDVSPTVSGLPPEVTQVLADVVFVQGDDFVFGPSASGLPADGSATLSGVIIPNGFAQPLTSVRLEHGDTDFVQVGRVASADALALTYDHFVPLPSTFEISGPMPRQTLTWSVGGGPGDADLVILEADAEWWVIAPPSATTLQFPEVPAEFQRSEPMFAHTIALASPEGADGYRDALPLLPEVNAIFFTASTSADRISLIGDLDPRIIELP
jgi:hypothetical protein